MDVIHNPKLTANELSAMWGVYMNASMTEKIISYFRAKNEDDEASIIITNAIQVMVDVQRGVEHIFTKESIPVPNAFGTRDVRLDAPRLFSDIFALRFIQFTASGSMVTMATSEATVGREDVRKMFHTFYLLVSELYHEVLVLLQRKGVYVRSPILVYPEKTENVSSKKFLSNLVGEHRPLLHIEVSHIAKNLETNSIGRTLMIGFLQVVQTEELKTYFLKGKDIAAKHEHGLSSLLIQDNIPSPSTWDSTVSRSTESPFSEKLMLFLISMLNGTSIGNYGLAIGASARRDVNVKYAKMLVTVGRYANDGAKLMIDKGWMEEPPQNADRASLSNQ